MNRDGLLELSSTVVEAQGGAVLEYLARGVGTGKVSAAMAEIYSGHDANVSAFERALGGWPAKVDCRRGCSFCCTQRVAATAPEVFAAVAHVTKGMDTAELQQFREKAAATAARVVQHGDLPIFNVPIQCVFLTAGECSVYPQRPLACRGETSASAKLCEEGFNDSSKAAQGKPENGVIKAVVLGFVGALGLAIQSKGIDDRWYELNTAVHEALSDSGCEERWLSGRQAFNHAFGMAAP